MKVQELVKEFADCVIAQNKAMAADDVQTGNRFAKRRASAFKRLRSYGTEGREALAVLLNHERADVRVKAAAFLLRHCHDRASAVLATEAKGKGLIAFEAGQALERWKDGTWQLDPAD